MSLNILDTAPVFKGLKGIDGKVYSLSDFTDDILVVIFSCNHCPYVHAYENRYKTIQDKYLDKGVRFVLINSNDASRYPEDSFDNMAKRHKDRGYNAVYLSDDSQSTARDFGATNTPHVFVLDAARALQYVGRIDDSWDDELAVKQRDLENALNDILAGKRPQINSTLPVGCSIKWK